MIDIRKFNQLNRGAAIGLYSGLAAVLLLFLVSGLISYLNIRTLRYDAELVAHSHEVLSTLEDVLSLAKDAETGQRGFVITGDANYLDPYNNAVNQIDSRLADFERLVQDNPSHLDRLPVLKAKVHEKMDELAETVDLRRAQGFEAARAVVVTDRGKGAMDVIRMQIRAIEQDEEILRRERVAERERAFGVAVMSGIITGLFGAFLSGVVAYLLRRFAINRQRQERLQSAQIKLGEVISGEQPMSALAENVLRFLTEYLDAHAGAFFVKDGAEYRRLASYGVPASAKLAERFGAGDSLLAQAARDRKLIAIHDVPDGYLVIGSALGQSNPRDLIIVPMTTDGETNAVMEFGFIHPLDEYASELFDRVSESIAVAIRSVHYRSNLQHLLEETQRQTEELQTQGEELRVSNEELEEQSRALRESQSRLENQQAELSATNTQLEEQTQLLESQRIAVEQARDGLQLKARQLEQASQYKSDFLANMSHELRTPLNSSLILAKLLADNFEGNLTEEQVQFAETIQTAGNDLLTLINDILDLSKIEAGHMEVHAETFDLAQLLHDLGRAFRPMAEQKQVGFQAQILAGCPAQIHTDRHRLEQILKNLLSNAIKFTQRGQIALSVTHASEGRVTFAVTDTGIGIPADKLEIIFEAFRQADGTTNRKFGGTGLGLSISRELARLLGGEIHVASELDRSSTFTLTIPESYDGALTPRQTPGLTVELAGSSGPKVFDRNQSTALVDSAPHSPKVPPAQPTGRIPDDRDKLTASKHVLLVVEDDEPFARILFNLAHQLDFQCLIATTAEEGFALAYQHLPSAAVLDIGLPDHSGLWVLDRLKHDRRTRHIPVHVASANDFTETALSLGAVGYMLKPVKREELVEALKNLETRFAQRTRRVLVVEDDPVQLASLQKLLRSKDVETVGAANAASCLEFLKNQTFDCMVLDLSLPDASGYALLETLSSEEAYSFPPVIVYTGRELSTDEEQRLRRYSKSIIIKGAKSPERLLDEVTLFLHQVVSELPIEQQRMLETARSRDAAIEGRRILLVEDDVRNVFALTSIFEPRGAIVQIARNGREALAAIEKSAASPGDAIDLVLMDLMMPEMDGLTAVQEIRRRPQWQKLPVIMLTAKAMQDDQERCLAAGANDYMAKPLDVDKLVSLVRVWMPR
jgi:signal transduction histidine kinase/CheY-like chemotaxis protein/CHASE3 domain sensor protein